VTATFALAFGAGALTMFSPCVIPVIPLVMAGASRAARFGPTFLLLGLIISFSITGTFATALIFYLDFPPNILSDVGGIALVVVGGFLLFPALDKVFKQLTTGPANYFNGLLDRIRISGGPGQFLTGMVIGVIWAPCTGPTLGAAVALASQQENLTQSFFTMLSFSAGAAVPLGVLGTSANKLAGKRSLFMKYGAYARIAMALLFMAIGISILLSFQKLLEAWVLELLPEWWIKMITSL